MGLARLTLCVGVDVCSPEKDKADQRLMQRFAAFRSVNSLSFIMGLLVRSRSRQACDAFDIRGSDPCLLL